jgi:hypothetical protein
MRVLDRHAQHIEVSSFLSKLPRVGVEEMEMVERLAPQDIIPVLQAVGVDFVLAGAHGISGWLKEPRATQDVDFIIHGKDKRKVSDALLKAHPDWKQEKFPDVWRFKKGDAYLVDLMVDRAPLMKRVMKEATVVTLHKRKVKIPSLESALALKFAAMTGYFRNLQKKYSDASDFIGMARPGVKLDMKLLKELGELVYSGGGEHLIQYVEDARAGRKLEI